MNRSDIRPSSQIRQDFVDFFKSRKHTIVPSSSLMPDAPNLLFTNAGMNQFVPFFLGGRKPDVSKWAGAEPSLDTRAADTQKCIRAGGKHNDLEDVGLDTYHHTFFEMLGNWSFGDYFKQEAIEWAWELITGVWKFPKERLYATVYKPGEGDPADFDQEAYDIWEKIFTAAGLDPKIHIVNGNKKDNFWMMGETGPCGPCSELHVDLTPAGDTKGRLVNCDSAECIEIWNLVFIQFNADPDGTFAPLPAKHVDTGMGFERVASILQCTRHFTDFNATISNYETDVFRPIFDEIEKLSGQKYTSTLPKEGASHTEQEQIDVAFRVIADHIRTLGFSIADGIQPGNTDRNYVLRRILRRAVKYGRTLGFHEPFFYKLVDILAATMGDVFPEIRAKKKHVQEVIRIEEEAFNKTLDRGIEMFNAEAERLTTGMGSARVPRAGEASRRTPQAEGARYSKRNLPHFERPWAKYMATFTTIDNRELTPEQRDIVLESILFGHRQRRYQLYAACVMPDHAHLLFEPQVKETDAAGNPVFWSLTELMHGIKSFTAHEMNKQAGQCGINCWQKESFDRMIRSDSDLQEKYRYICKNPWEAQIVTPEESYPWLWIPAMEVEDAPETAHRDGSQSTRDACAPQITGDFAFRLYDTYGFPLDLTELMARERGLTVDTGGFEKLMEEQRQRARASQKKEVITLADSAALSAGFHSGEYVKVVTEFVGFDLLEVNAKVQKVALINNKQAVLLDKSPCYAEMGGQVGDTGQLIGNGQLWQISNTQKSDRTWLHFIGGDDAPEAGSDVTVAVHRNRRAAIQRHHTVTHLLHWALHEVVSREASQKGSFVGPDKLTFDFNAAALTPQQIADVEKLVNERILENEGVSWSEVPYADVKSRDDVMHFFGDKYGDVVRVVQIGGESGALNGYSMELCGGTHTRATGEIGLFRIAGESAIAAGVRRIEAVAGLEAYRHATHELELVRSIAGKINTPVGELEKKIESMLAHQKELEKALKSAKQREAAQSAKSLVDTAVIVNAVSLITKNLGEADGDTLQAVADALKGTFKGVVVLGGTNNGNVALSATVSSDLTKRVQAGKIIQHIAPIVGGKGGGRPDNARGGGKDPARLDEALAAVKPLL